MNKPERLTASPSHTGGYVSFRVFNETQRNELCEFLNSLRGVDKVSSWTEIHVQCRAPDYSVQRKIDAFLARKV